MKLIYMDKYWTHFDIMFRSIVNKDMVSFINSIEKRDLMVSQLNLLHINL